MSRLEKLGSTPWWSVPLSLCAVGAFAFAQPLLDLLGRNPEFFIARGFRPSDVVLFPLALLAAPALLSLVVLALRWVGPRASGLAHAIVMGSLFALLAATAWNALLGPSSPWLLMAAVTVGAGALFGVAYARTVALQTWVRYAAWALAVFAGWFLAMTPAGDVAFATTGDLPEIGDIPNPVPIVVIVFDEFPVATIIDSQGNLLDEQFPHLADLAADGVWYRNAVGVRQQTEEALPTILTGVGADEGSIPTSSDHPLNLFTMYTDSYEVAAVETVTNLCPGFVCTNSSRRTDPFLRRWGALTVDLSVVYGHLALPASVSDALPAIDRTWGNFATGERSDFDIIDRFLANVDDDRRLEVQRFLDTFDLSGPEPDLRFAHFLFPHHPWEVTADGRRTGAGNSPGGQGAGWKTDEWLVGQGYQRHILQTQYADTIVGSVVERMKDEGVYDEAVLVVVADHGITIAPGVQNQRTITPDTIGTIAAVPLFVKYPVGTTGAEPGTIDDVRAETVDILPTIAEVTGATVPWEVDGVSLLDEATRAQRTGSVMVGRRGPVQIGTGGEEKLAAAAEKEGWFPDGDPWSLTPTGWAGLLGTRVDSLTATEADDVSIQIEQQLLLNSVDEDAPILPVFLSGTGLFDTAATGEEILVVSVDGVIEAVTRVYEPNGRSAEYEVMIRPELLHQGQNDVDVWLARGGPESPTLLH